jgi:cation diffusion facilitator CzcD-associated flavoprotein CzcO
VNPRTGNITDVAIIGAGPYGLSIAAHLAARGIPFRIFGKPMSVWSTQMPQGMQLKSEGFASSLSHPNGEFTLKDYCTREGIAYKHIGLPVRLETFVAYGVAFQKEFVPNLEDKLVTSVEPDEHGFQLVLDKQEKVLARSVVVATGIANFAWVPELLGSLPTQRVSHSSQHSDLTQFRDKRVAVVGSGASALDLATLLHEGGAHVELIARSSTIHFHNPPPKKVSLRGRLMLPVTPIGPGWSMLFYVHAPGLFRLLPEHVRLDHVRSALGPAPGWFVKDRIVGKIPFHLGVEISAASAQNGGVKLELTKEGASAEMVEVDHVIAATGYRVDLGRLSFLDPELRQRIRLTAGSPMLSANFESTVPDLYFVGLSAANTFGPVLRFACGANFAADRLAGHFGKRARRVTAVRKTEDSKVYERA